MFLDIIVKAGARRAYRLFDGAEWRLFSRGVYRASDTKRVAPLLCYRPHACRKRRSDNGGVTQWRVAAVKSAS